RRRRLSGRRAHPRSDRKRDRHEARRSHARRPPARARGRAGLCWRRGSRPRHQRRLRANARPSDRDGLRRQRARRGGHRTGNRSQGQASSRPGRDDAFRPPSLLPRKLNMARYFTEEHEWIDVEGETATVGITDYAQEQLGDIVFVELPQTGTALEKGKDAAVVESVKAASDVYAPISGEVTEANAALEDDPALVNS